MQATKWTIDRLRVVIDFGSAMLAKVQGPLRSFIDRQAFDAPWVWILAFSVGMSTITSLAYPYFAEWADPDPRVQRERERIREALQRGEDPLPFLKHRDINKNAKVPLQIVYEEDYPPEASEEYRIMQRYKKHRLELYQKHRAEEEEKARREAEKAIEDEKKKAWW
jgi:hypothetical protein